MSSEFVTLFKLIQKDIYATAVEKGWWNTDEVHNDGEKIALMHSELSEALEGLRHGNPKSKKIPNYSNVEEELADVIIRIMDYAEHKGFDISNAILEKHAYNKGRAYKHGGKNF